ncbi:hypothetical protein KP803_15650 [Vibrio sp. ZSDE26]|uniref:Secreted protein n=1 Tax=Vibrio amylolyticus TaxID=2847292 RepID=A0A9X1XSH9_9VIBR|nr:hypothetical protein [Vibrio amylolyticus]MCK6264714.1 hypothetical protein [Vibrio amylolyticus]
MKHSALITLLLLITTSIALANTDSKTSRKIGTATDDKPCTCVFNKNRMWNPEKIVWNNEEWHCSEYKEDGTCASVATLSSGQSKQNPCSKQTVPLYCAFNLDNAPKYIEIENDTWQCTAYDEVGKCIKSGKI